MGDQPERLENDVERSGRAWFPGMKRIRRSLGEPEGLEKIWLSTTCASNVRLMISRIPPPDYCEGSWARGALVAGEERGGLGPRPSLVPQHGADFGRGAAVRVEDTLENLAVHLGEGGYSDGVASDLAHKGAPGEAGEAFVAGGVGFFALDDHASIRAHEEPFNDPFDAIGGSAGDILLDTGKGIFIQGNGAGEGVGIGVNQDFLGVFFAEVFEPIGGIGIAIVFVEEIDGVFEEVLMGPEDVVAVFLIFLGGLFVGGADLGDDLEIWAELEGFFEGVGDEAAALEAQLHGLVDDTAERDEVVRLDFGGILGGFAQAEVSPIDGMSLGEAPFEGSILGIHLFHDQGIPDNT